MAELVIDNQKQVKQYFLKLFLRMVGFLFVLGCLTAATLFIYWYFLAPPYWDKTFGQLDERFYFAPQAFFLDVSLQKGEFPLWNPLAYGGAPLSRRLHKSNRHYHLINMKITPEGLERELFFYRDKDWSKRKI